MTKREMIAALEAAGVKVNGKLNVVALTALMTEHKLIPAEGSDGNEDDGEGNDDAATDAQAECDAAANAAEVEAPKPRELTTGTVPAPKSLKIEKARPTSNGITRPSIGGLCRAIWDKLDQLSATGQPLPTAKQLALTHGWNLSTVGRQSAEWRKFNGLPKKAAEDATAE